MHVCQNFHFSSFKGPPPPVVTSIREKSYVSFLCCSVPLPTDSHPGCVVGVSTLDSFGCKRQSLTQEQKVFVESRLNRIGNWNLSRPRRWWSLVSPSASLNRLQSSPSTNSLPGPGAPSSCQLNASLPRSTSLTGPFSLVSGSEP